MTNQIPDALFMACYYVGLGTVVLFLAAIIYSAYYYITSSTSRFGGGHGND